MTEQTAEADTTEQQQPPEGSSGKPEAKTFDADYVAKLRKEAAQYRTEAKANADAAKRLAEIEEANKSEVQRAADKLAAAERDAAEARAEALRLRIAVKYQISDEDADLFLTGTDEDTLTKQAERLAAREEAREAERQAAEVERKKNGNFVAREGNAPDNTDTDALGILGFG